MNGHEAMHETSSAAQKLCFWKADERESYAGLRDLSALIIISKETLNEAKLFIDLKGF